MRLSIIIPCFNEVQSIFEVFRRVEAAPLPDGWTKEIIIVDDGSDEATKRELARIGQGKSAPTIIYRTRNGGKGAAVKDGLRAASGAYVIVQDADLEYDPNDYMALLAPIVAGEASVVFGSRVLKDNNVPYNFAYFYGGLLVTKLFNFAFRTKLSDIATCYKVFPGKLIPQLVLSSHDDFVFDAVDLTLACIRSGPIREVPISYSARTKRSGKKLNWIHGIEIVFAIALARVGIPVTRRAGATKIVRFLVSGGAAAVVNFTTLFALTEFAHIWYLISSGIAFVAAFIVSFMMQKYWTFRNDDIQKIRTQLPQHLTVAVFNLVLNLALVYMLVEYLGIWYMFAQAIATALIAVESFFAFRWIFR